MSHYSNNPDSVRVDFFKPSGKYYTTEAVDFYGYSESDLVESFSTSLKKHLNGRLSGMTAVCLEPYHVNAHPVMVIV